MEIKKDIRIIKLSIMTLLLIIFFKIYIKENKNNIIIEKELKEDNIIIEKELKEDLNLLDSYIKFAINEYCKKFNIDNNFSYNLYEDLVYKNLERINYYEEDSSYKGDLAKPINNRLINNIYFFTLYNNDMKLYLKINTHNMKFNIYKENEIIIIDNSINDMKEAYDKIIFEDDDYGNQILYYPNDYVETDLKEYNYKLYSKQWVNFYNEINEFDYKKYDNIKIENYDEYDKVNEITYKFIAYSFIEYFKRNDIKDSITINLYDDSPRVTNMIFTIKIDGKVNDYYIDLDMMNLKSHIYEIQ